MSLRPQCLKKLVLRHDSPSMLDEVSEHVKSLWTDRHAIAIAPEKVVHRIQTERLEKLHGSTVAPYTAHPESNRVALLLSVRFGVIWRLGKPGLSCLTVSVTKIQREQDWDVTPKAVSFHSLVWLCAKLCISGSD